jgi:multidrug transporter EmrE-like cation transporter
MTNALYLAVAILLNSYSNIVIKVRATDLGSARADKGIASYIVSMALDPWVWTAAVAFASAALLWLLVVRRIDLSVAQPAMALVFVIVPLAAMQFLGEPMPPLRMAGIALILLGVIFVARTA